MEYYFNELSCLQPAPDRTTVYGWIENLAKTCIEAKKIGFKTFRSTVYLSQIEIVENYLLGDWMRDRSIGNRDLQRKFQLLDAKVPLLEIGDETFSQLEWAGFSHEQNTVAGMAVAFLKSSICISLPSHIDWSGTSVEFLYEYLDEENQDETNVSIVTARHCSIPEHIETHREFAIEKLKTLPPPSDWNPAENYLPNVEASNFMLAVEEFYQTNRNRSRGEQIANIRVTASQIAELNHYKKDDSASRRNRTNERIRDIYKSQNDKGRQIYLSVDVEIGAFEVCDYAGIHIEEILFDGTPNGGQELDHSIQV